MFDRVAIREAASAGLSVAEIAQSVGATSATVRRALDPAAPVTYQRARLVDGDIGAQIRQVIARNPRMKAPGIAYQVGWRGSMRTLRHVIQQIKRQDMEVCTDGQPPASSSSR
ncbi:Transposase and inactivated derivatives [Actinomyces bovis]|uniref:Transposase and inactivated derivatives n=1 Tax=Actinomyces bovis TaxID=1658 RepID=A0ABY1VRX1_9ACTO|nr:hypothetical protein [Actinomyces bovis]SPT53788.1 Transposase and inactivated derivatives [Actinomyces bovis]VEG53140.1 Transposase and inactivated derivatives [Actinomyces israelii]